MSNSSPWTPPPVEELQRMLPQYKIEAMIGHGGMGAVYKGEQEALERAVAIKILPESLVEGEDEHNFTERFRQEAKAMAGLDHPAIISVFDFGQTESGHLYFVMEFIDGMDIQKFIELSGGKVSAEYSISIVSHVLDALEYAHGKGIIHRDIKPANILINSEGKVKIADFGLAKRLAAGPSTSEIGITKTNMAVGTPDFIAPEALDIDAQLDARADLYSVGVMLYQMLTGTLPRGIFDLPNEAFPELDVRFDEIITHALESNPEYRYQSATEFRAKLGELLSKPVPKVIPSERIETASNLSTRAPGQTGVIPGQSIAAVPRQEVERAHRREAKGAPFYLTITIAVVALAAAGFAILRPGPEPEMKVVIHEPVVLSPAKESEENASESGKPNSEMEFDESKEWPTGPHFTSAGRFHAWSSIPNDPVMDISKLAEVDDPKQISITEKLWIVLRENGQTTSNQPRAEQEGIQRLLPASSTITLLTDEGSILTVAPSHQVSGAGYPEDMRGIVDAYVAWHCGAVLNEEGEVYLWGLATQEAARPEWSKEFLENPIPDGRSVVSISGLSNSLFFHLDDGSVLDRHLSVVNLSEKPFMDAEVTDHVEINKFRVGIPTVGQQAIAFRFGRDLPSERIPHSGKAEFVLGGEAVCLVLNEAGKVHSFPSDNETRKQLSEVVSLIPYAEPDLISVIAKIPHKQETEVIRLLWYEKDPPAQPVASPRATELTEQPEAPAGTVAMKSDSSPQEDRKPENNPVESPKDLPGLAVPERERLKQEIARFQSDRSQAFSKLAGFYLNALKRQIEKLDAEQAEPYRLESELILGWREQSLASLKSYEVQTLTVPPPLGGEVTERIQKNRATLEAQLAEIDVANRGDFEQVLRDVISELNRKDQIDEARQVEAYRVALAKLFPVSVSSGSRPGEEIETLPYLLTEMSLRHGTLHSWSNRNDDLAVDVTAAEDRDDFVQVYTFLGGWIALTADGTAISSDPQYNRTRIARICGGLHTSFGLIDFDGNLEAITIDAAKPEEPLNEVVDAFVSETHSIALFENGRIHTWGPAYRGETPDRLIWEPAPRTLRRIKKIIGSTVVGAAVSEEGELTAWTHAGEGQFGETVNQEIRDVTARPTGLRVINREGHFYWWNAEGNGYRKRTDLAEELGPISEIFDNSGNCNLIRLEKSNEVTTDSGAAKSEGIEKYLTHLEGLPDYAFSLYDDVGIYRLLWIEYED